MTNKIEILLNDQLLEVDMNDLQGNDDALIGILQKDAKNHHLFLEFALEYYKRRMNLEFEKFLLAGKSMNLPHKNDSFVLMLNTLACYYIETATRIKGTTNTLQGPFGNQRNSADLINQATQIINEVEQIKRNKFTFVLKANLLFIKGESDQTIPNLKAALNLDRNFIPALIGLANALFKKNDFKNALLHYQQILELIPDISPDVRIPIGICFYELDMVNEAKLAFERALERDSDNANATMFLALLGLNQARTKSSETKKLIKDANAKILNAYKFVLLTNGSPFYGHNAKVMAQAACIYSKCSELKSSALAIHGRILHSQNDFHGAFEKYKEAAALDPSSLIIKFNLSQMYIQSGNIEKALSLLESILEKDANDYDTLKLLFFIYSNSSSNEFVEKAAKIWQSLQRILFVDGKEIIIRDEELLADVAKYLETTGIQQSRKYYHDLLNLLQEKGKNASPQLLNNLAVLYHLESQEITSAYSNGYRKNYRIEVNGFDEKNLLNSLESSEALYQQALMAASAEDYVHSTEQGTVSAVQITIRYNVARLFEVMGEIEKAESHYQEILKIHPAYEDCLFRLGVISSNRNENDQALDYYSRVLAFNPENPTAWYMVGNHHMITKNYRAARKSFEKVLESNRYDIYALCSVGNLCLIFARGDPDPKNRLLHFSRSIEYFCKALSVEPKSVHAAAGIAIAYAETQKYQDACTVFNQIQEMAPGDSNFTLLAAHTLVENGQINLAIGLYETVLKKTAFKNDATVLPAISRAYYILAKTSKDMDAMKLALSYIQKAIYAQPWDKSLFYNLALIEQQTSQSLNEQSLEQRSIEALKLGLERLDSSEKYFKFLGQQDPNMKYGYDVKRASERAIYCKGVKKVSEKKIHETEVLQRQREERLLEIKSKMEKDALKQRVQQEEQLRLQQEREIELTKQRKELMEKVQLENERNRIMKRDADSDDADGSIKRKGKKKVKTIEKEDSDDELAGASGRTNAIISDSE